MKLFYYENILQIEVKYINNSLFYFIKKIKFIKIK